MKPPTPEATWQSRAESKRNATLKKIPQEWQVSQSSVPSATESRDVTGPYIQQFLTPREIEITETDAVGITRQTTSGEWAALEVTKAFCHRAAIAHQLVNCLHEIFFDAAIQDAKRLDAYYAEHRKPIGPLHGLPVSLKDQFHVKGVETTMGYVGWIDTFQGTKDDARNGVFESELVRELRALGAVLYVKTSVPSTLMTDETVNNIIGYTWNPKNRLLSSGGSSGGEAALIALKGSPAGFGTDIGGSIRIPAASNGLYALRPSAGRLPYEGTANSMDGQNIILSTVGPLASSAGSLTLLVKSVLSQQPWYHDPLAVELPWRDEIVEGTLNLIQESTTGAGKLAFGVLRHEGSVRPQPPVARGIEIVVDLLIKLGHKVIEWQPPSHKVGALLATMAFNADGGAEVRAHYALSDEPQPVQIAVNNPPAPQKTSLEIAAINVAKREWQKSYIDYWNSTIDLTGTGRPVDAVLSPTGVHAAAIPEKSRSVGYSSVLNTLDYTSVVIPVTHADKTIDVIPPSESYLSALDKTVQEEYDPEIYDGAPVGIQLFGRRFQEEKILTLAEYIGNELQRHE